MSHLSTDLAPYFELCDELQLPRTFVHTVSRIYLPLADLIQRQATQGPLLVSINGAQGSGKSTLTQFLHRMLAHQYHREVVSFSIDDFYFTRAQRIALSQSIHPLLITRGVPGTHDLDFMELVLQRLLAGAACKIPVFNKAVDDRRAEQEWKSQSSPVDIILFEGWCNDSPAQTPEQLLKPINQLEAEEDAGGEWRDYANEKLIEYRRRIFSRANYRVFLQAPSFDQVFSWRKLQEHKLKNRNAFDPSGKIMNDKELRRFIQHYERITRHTLSCYATCADIVLPINSEHEISALLPRDNNHNIASD